MSFKNLTKILKKKNNQTENVNNQEVEMNYK